ncbi:MAG TPA: ABC transporter permease [Rhodococcus sp. (in: high G+C Gram-positive bacteria)]|nr:ABC transporter permease [Rhodococcus sp. (in: high G+C Gram-positive bacteria)]
MSATPPVTGASPIARAIALAAGAAVIVGVVLLAFAWPAVTSEPHDLPVGVVGPDASVAQTTGMLEAQSGDALVLTREDTRDEAIEAIERREIYGAIILGDGPADMPEILVATAANAQVAQILQGIATGMQQQIDTQLRAATEAAITQRLANPAAPNAPASFTIPQAEVPVTDVVPFSDSDARGVKLSVAAFPLVLGGMAGAVLISFGVTRASHRIAALVTYAVVGGLLLGAILQGMFGALQGSYWTNAAAIGLALVAITAPIVGLRSLIGTPGIGVGAVLMMLVANPISAATMPVEFLLSPWGAIGQWFPPGAGATLLKELSYFPEASTAFSWAVLAGWTAVGVLLTAIAVVRERRTTAIADNPELAPVG